MLKNPTKNLDEAQGALDGLEERRTELNERYKNVTDQLAELRARLDDQPPGAPTGSIRMAINQLERELADILETREVLGYELADARAELQAAKAEAARARLVFLASNELAPLVRELLGRVYELEALAADYGRLVNEREALTLFLAKDGGARTEDVLVFSPVGVFNHLDAILEGFEAARPGKSNVLKPYGIPNRAERRAAARKEGLHV